ncbi:hypothetical protein yc1106_06137 [Curvularia clavata]|uniref:Uncharacterized protein n=1 Tax=Curvularia clavata TaxID=95742 RepID=A0A9Q9DSP7_CURCL|nr:hypothetical protein yc1106_06137 [Curvularia clavata]
MPFHDEKWEELQRDCDIFPAYSDYLYGPDRRLVVTQEPGLHPSIYPTPTPQPAQNAYGMPMDPSEPRRRLRTVSEKEDPRGQAISQQHGYACVPSTSQRDAYSTSVGVTQQQYHTHHYATPTQQIQHHQSSGFTPPPPTHAVSLYLFPIILSKPTSVPQLSSTPWPTRNSGHWHSAYALVQPSNIFPEVTAAVSHQASAQLRAHINPHIPQLWHCLQLTLQNHVQTSQAAIKEQNCAHQWLLSFKHSLPPEGRTYLAQVVARMNLEKAAGRDPLLSLGFRT